MGQSSSFQNLRQDLLEEYFTLTYLSKSEIVHLYKTCTQLGQAFGETFNDHYRFETNLIEEAFPQLRFNPFRDRIYNVFSSEKDNRMSFEDILDLCSVMSEKCPDTVKSAWAFKIFDFDGDNAVGEEDLKQVIDRLTTNPSNPSSHQLLQDADKEKIINVLLQEIDLEKNGSISQLEFEHAVGKMSEFPHSFCFKL